MISGQNTFCLFKSVVRLNLVDSCGFQAWTRCQATNRNPKWTRSKAGEDEPN